MVKLNSTSIGGDDVTCTTGSYHGGLALPSSPLQLFVLCRHMSDFCFDTDADCPFDVDAECPSSSPEPAALCFRGCGRVTRSTFDEDGCVLHGRGCAIGGQHDCDPQCDAAHGSASSPVCCIPASLLLCQDPSCSLLLYSHRTTVLIAVALKQIDRAHCCCTHAHRPCPLLLYSRTSTVLTVAVLTHIDVPTLSPSFNSCSKQIQYSKSIH